MQVGFILSHIFCYFFQEGITAGAADDFNVSTITYPPNRVHAFDENKSCMEYSIMLYLLRLDDTSLFYCSYIILLE